MERRIIFILVFVSLSLNLFGDNEAQQINLEHQHQYSDHNEYYNPADMPEVYYDRSNQEIILVALFTSVNGYGDTIDVSTLPNDNYKIVISTPYNNIYEGYFTNY